MPERKPKRTRPRDPNQLAKLVFDIASGEVEDTVSEAKRHPENVKGRAVGKKGGKSRAKTLSPEQRIEIARIAAEARSRIAAEARWKKK